MIELMIVHYYVNWWTSMLVQNKYALVEELLLITLRSVCYNLHFSNLWEIGELKKVRLLRKNNIIHILLVKHLSK